jgi:aryl carrier-like protein
MLADILGIEHVPAHRVLHELGATSLHIVQLHAKLCAAGHRLDKVDIFRFPTVEQLADFLAGTEPVGAGQTSDPEQHQKRRREQIARLRGRRHD